MFGMVVVVDGKLREHSGSAVDGSRKCWSKTDFEAVNCWEFIRQYRFTF
jgi:hypothetical protein